MLDSVTVPDLWQQQAVSALQAGKDVVVHAPTGAGKTLIFELWSNQGKPRGKAVYTVPTRALANDKLAEWRARGWNVGIATGDLSENLDAPVIGAVNGTAAGAGLSLACSCDYVVASAKAKFTLAYTGAGQAWKAEMLYVLAGVDRDSMPRTLVKAPRQWVCRWRGRWGAALRCDAMRCDDAMRCGAMR